MAAQNLVEYMKEGFFFDDLTRSIQISFVTFNSEPPRVTNVDISSPIAPIMNTIAPI